MNLKFLKNYFIKQKSATCPIKPIVAFEGIANAIYTPKSYESLAKEGYQNNVIVYRCINLIAKGIASIPWLCYEKDKMHDKELNYHPLVNLLDSPSPMQSGSAFVESLVSHLLLSGNAYIEAIKDNNGNICELHALRPDRVRVIPCSFKGVKGFEYRVKNNVKNYFINEDEFSPILHIKNFHPLNDWYGMSPIEAAGGSIDQHNAVSNHNLSLLQNGGRPSGALVIKPNESAQNPSSGLEISLYNR